MRAVIQRVSRARVTVDGAEVGAIDAGYLVLLGVAAGDGTKDAEVMAAKIAGLRLFSDAEGRMNQSLTDVDGSILLVSQFTLLADVRKGRRPSFVNAAAPESAEDLVSRVGSALTGLGVAVEDGRFGAAMQVELINDGPVTIVIEVIDGRIAGPD